jgi:hypothetical protein
LLLAASLSTSAREQVRVVRPLSEHASRPVPRRIKVTQSTCVQRGPIVLLDPNYLDFATDVIDALLSSRVKKRDAHALYAGMPCARDDGLWLEFGVFQGDTIKQIAEYRNERVARDTSLRGTAGRGLVYGFDSFHGLPEAWRNTSSARVSKYVQQGSFSLAGRPPFPAGNGVEWVVGWFNESLPPFLERHKGEPLSLLHVDSDLYSSAITIFNALRARGLLVPGVVLIFDELFNYREYLRHEMRALWELLTALSGEMQQAAAAGPEQQPRAGVEYTTAEGASNGTATTARPGGERAHGSGSMGSRTMEMAVEVLGSSTHDIIIGVERWPQACAMRLVSVDRGWAEKKRAMRRARR